MNMIGAYLPPAQMQSPVEFNLIGDCIYNLIQPKCRLLQETSDLSCGVFHS